MTNRIPLEQKVLSDNERIAAGLRARFEAHGVFCLNILGSPGAGKTFLLERTLEMMPPSGRIAVLTGDIQTDNDARRLARFGFPARQITTGGTCHLDARMVENALSGWDVDRLDLLLIENVGNLVCPAGYDLGQAARVVMMSVCEGDDKPLKYPAMFHRADLVVISKIDLLPWVPFDIESARNNSLRVHPEIEILQLSALSGEGLGEWVEWLKRRTALAEQAERR